MNDSVMAAFDCTMIDGRRALADLVALCKLGPRISGSSGMKEQQDRLAKFFVSLGGQVEFQRFQVQQVSRSDTVDMANLVVAWHPDQKRRIMLCTHYDTRPIADEEPNEQDWSKPFLGANDGASGVACLMELGRNLNFLKTKVGVDFVFFDGEEFVFDPRPAEEGGDRLFLGSEHFARSYLNSPPTHHYQAAVLLDMVAGQDASFLLEPYSYVLAGTLVEEIWSIAAEQKCECFKNQWGPAVQDDHLPLNEAGIPSVDIIDCDYPHWHRLSDLPENCSGKGLEQVAKVLAVWLQCVQ